MVYFGASVVMSIQKVKLISCIRDHTLLSAANIYFYM